MVSDLPKPKRFRRDGVYKPSRRLKGGGDPLLRRERMASTPLSGEEDHLKRRTRRVPRAPVQSAPGRARIHATRGGGPIPNAWPYRNVFPHARLVLTNQQENIIFLPGCQLGFGGLTKSFQMVEIEDKNGQQVGEFFAQRQPYPKEPVGP